MGDNICGPCVLRVPAWVRAPLGRYYLYFADHRGSYIRLAFAERPEGPWRTHPPGCLHVTDSLFCTSTPNPPSPPSYWQQDGDGWRRFLYPHVASPDVLVDEQRREFRMYFHGLLPDGDQATRVASSEDGLRFHVHPALLAPPYLRVFTRRDGWYGIAMPNLLLRSDDGLQPFRPCGVPLPGSARHTGLLADEDTLHLFWSELDEAPERIHYGRVPMRGAPADWRLETRYPLMAPELPWEGAAVAAQPGGWGASDGLRNELRDPYPFVDHGRLLLFYAGGGERGIGVAECTLPEHRYPHSE